MKKRIIGIILLIIAITFTTTEVKAIRVRTEIDAAYSTGITWRALGNDTAGTGPYEDHVKRVVVNGQKFTAYCLDPGLRMSNGTLYDCSPLSDPGALQIVKSNLDYSTTQLALRFYAAMKGYGSSALKEMKAAVVRFHQIKSGLGTVMQAACQADGSALTCSANPYDYLSGNQALVDAAYALAQNARSSIDSLTNASGGLTYTKDASSTKDKVVFKVTSLQKLNKVKFVCEDCTINGEDTFENVGGSPITLEVRPAPDCQPFTIKAYYVPEGIHICHNANSSVQENFQYLVADFDASAYGGAQEIDTSGDPIDVHIDTGIGCEEECCTEGPVLEPGYIEGNVNNCCYDDTHSEAREYNLNDLVCYSEDFKVDHYWKKCDVEPYQDVQMQGELNEYCDIYCTERVTVDIPHAITATSGRYFELTTTVYGTKSPYVQGFKRCRMLIHFKKWQDAYRKQVEEQVKQYKIFQENRLKELGYKDAIDASRDCTWKAKVTCTGDSASESLPAENNQPACSASVTIDPGDCASVDFGPVNYKQFNFVGTEHLNKRYYWPKLDEKGFKQDADGYYNYYKLLEDGSGQYTHRDYSYFSVKDQINSAHTKYNECSSRQKSDSDGRCTATAYLKCKYEYTISGSGCNSSEDALVAEHEDVVSTYNSYKSTAAAALAKYQAAAQTAKELEKKLTDCDEYFTAGPGANAAAHYNFNPSFFGFEYSQVYLTEYGDLQKDVSIIGFDNSPGCTIDGPILGPDGEDGLVAPQYSTLYYSDKITEAEDFKNTRLEWEESPQHYKTYLDVEYKADQRFVQDAKYHATCSWDEPENTKYTLVPKGIVQEGTFNTTKNDRQYQVYLATLEGTYDTRWLLSGIGSNSKFDAFFANGNVCSALQNATTDGLFHCGLKIDWEIIRTGKCNPTPSGKTVVKTEECEAITGTEQVLTFKIIDPAQVFTCSSYSDCGYGYNWFEEEHGRDALSEIKRRGENGETYSPSRVSYQISLNSKDMRQIKNYNEERENNRYGGYSDFSLQCECPESSEECGALSVTGGDDQTCRRSSSCNKCRSTFLDNLYNGVVKYNGTNHSVTKGIGSLGSIRDSGKIHWAED